MIVFPNAKINLGLNIVGKRTDGYHDLETVFYPIPLCDALEIKKMDEKFPSDTDCDLKVTGCAMDCDESQNLVVKAYQLIARDFKLPRIHAHLFKRIPMQAGLGGGSSDAAFMIKLLDERFRLNMGQSLMEDYAAQLGADCAYFMRNEIAFAQGKGEILQPADSPRGNLKGYWIVVVKPQVSVSTAEAFAKIQPHKPELCCSEVVKKHIGEWREWLHNDFEESVFAAYPELADIKKQLYGMGAAYAQMSGSGSAFFGIFFDKPQTQVEECFPDCFTFTAQL